jgi:uncharacterized protein (DUF2267 family)
LTVVNDRLTGELKNTEKSRRLPVGQDRGGNPVPPDNGPVRKGHEMKTTGITAIDHAPQVVAEWLNLLQEDLGWSDRGRAYLLLRETLHAIRDFLTVDEAADLSAQLPLLIRGIFFEGWVPAQTPAKLRSVDDFLDRVMARFKTEPPVEPDVAVAAVFTVLRRQVSPGEYRQVAWAMRKPLRDLWM